MSIYELAAKLGQAIKEDERMIRMEDKGMPVSRLTRILGGIRSTTVFSVARMSESEPTEKS
mgnify:CR=1 FL=1